MKHYCQKCNNKSGGVVKITLMNGDDEWFCAADFPPTLMTPAIQQVFAMRARDAQEACKLNRVRQETDRE